ncbi:probable S-adenosylmethionine-dependent methyltransferase (homolog to 24-sterol C-methyltransferase) [Natronomonas pharaonis DSM 2160]|uniref:Probable S-adenosylmethionine-dependent methyltransferase (Homolog to 24-sterol C-methyltransferase) n=1 Tax=Natronomonas pharaonis (strain ATCC 35678 / DSM 2160 / CIP 103997 / JCM 8858 / NBRC 14720 / NCIMB 2260 / Gabara) TaxID=348780 RepID=A0A1U7EUC9_NATPD|nr:class I SAM-dependent methyltransferase [Natronomonas pharaonis]CAI48569.1 probable S-adenosylmethionine-dependent methyltransferase (homolog to 24-sterol C-methyltransferase) [Natronomonas pharaonis DSM 2160]
MSVRAEFDAWAADGRDRGMEQRHWHTAKHALARMPVEADETVLDLGCGSGYAARALRDAKDAGRAYGLDGSPEMVRNAREYTDDPQVSYVVGDFGSLPFAADSIDHAFSMEAFYYAADPVGALNELRRVLRPGGTFYCAVDYFEESVHTHEWQEGIDIDMTLWDYEQYREAFREAGFYVAEQDTIPDRETEIPPEDEFPTDDWERREDMVERFREFGTLLTVGVAPA